MRHPHLPPLALHQQALLPPAPHVSPHSDQQPPSPRQQSSEGSIRGWAAASSSAPLCPLCQLHASTHHSQPPLPKQQHSHCQAVAAQGIQRPPALRHAGPGNGSLAQQGHAVLHSGSHSAAQGSNAGSCGGQQGVVGWQHGLCCMQASARCSAVQVAGCCAAQGGWLLNQHVLAAAQGCQGPGVVLGIGQRQVHCSNVWGVQQGRVGAEPGGGGGWLRLPQRHSASRLWVPAANGAQLAAGAALNGLAKGARNVPSAQHAPLEGGGGS